MNEYICFICGNAIERGTPISTYWLGNGVSFINGMFAERVHPECGQQYGVWKAALIKDLLTKCARSVREWAHLRVLESQKSRHASDWPLQHTPKRPDTGV